MVGEMVVMMMMMMMMGGSSTISPAGRHACMMMMIFPSQWEGRGWIMDYCLLPDEILGHFRLGGSDITRIL